MVGRDVVGDEVEDQPEPARCQCLARGSKPFGASELLIHDVVPDAVGRPGDVGGREVGQGAPEALDERRVGHCDRDPRRAPLPDAHQPDGVEAERCDRLPLGVRDAREVDRCARPPTQLVEPDPGVDLVDEWVGDHELSAPPQTGRRASSKYRQSATAPVSPGGERPISEQQPHVDQVPSSPSARTRPRQPLRDSRACWQNRRMADPHEIRIEYCVP